MKESQFSRKVLNALRARRANAVVFKINDRFTSGIPDAVVVLEGIATWLEFKCEDRKVTAIQNETLKRLKRGYVVRHKGPASYVHLVTSEYPVIDGPFKFDELVDHLVRICQSN